MAKVSDYFPLSEYLKKQASTGNAEVTLSFQEIENIIRRELPPTARKNSNWWANSQTEKSRQCSSWLNYGWSKYKVDLVKKIVVFRYVNK